MNARKSTLVILAAALGVAAFGYLSLDRQPSPPPLPQETSLAPIRTDAFIELSRFKESASATSTFVEGRIFAGTVNHHVLASDLMARLFKTLQASQPEARRFILISPDHFQKGRGPISTHSRDYQTANGRVRSDTAAVAELVSRGYVLEENGAMFEREHGIGALLPFLAREYGEVEVVPIALNGRMERDMARELGRDLASLVDDKTVVIVSSDMSHYLTESQALHNDQTTLRWLAERDAASMRRAMDDHTDNGPAFVVLFSMFEQMDLQPAFNLIDHSISSRYVPDRSNTTSYINGVWSIKNQ